MLFPQDRVGYPDNALKAPKPPLKGAGKGAGKGALRAFYYKGFIRKRFEAEVKCLG